MENSEFYKLRHSFGDICRYIVSRLKQSSYLPWDSKLVIYQFLSNTIPSKMKNMPHLKIKSCDSHEVVMIIRQYDVTCRKGKLLRSMGNVIIENQNWLADAWQHVLPKILKPLYEQVLINEAAFRKHFCSSDWWHVVLT